jgi:hypothetical protein
MPMRALKWLCVLAALASCAGGGAAPGVDALAPRALRAYGSEAELHAALDRWRAAAQQQRARRAAQESPALNAAPSMAPATAQAGKAASPAADAAAESITNVQTAGVDEGGIVKRAGEHLVILRRGRLFTVRVGGDSLQRSAVVDAYASGTDPQGAWYDELLISGSTVVVVGYSYARGGTEVGLFELSADGALAHRATYHLRSFDYYSSRNYASRLIGRKLVFYSPTLLQPWGAHPLQMMPGLRRWSDLPSEFERILPATRIYRSDDDFDPGSPLALHTVTSCDLGDAAMSCASRAVLGPPGRVFYVSAGSVYVWTNAGHRGAPAPADLSAVFRIPLDGAAPSALKTAGVPVDQLSFLEDGQGHLNVLLRESGVGEGMWGAEQSRGRLALLRVPLSAFGDGRDAAQREHYRRLPAPVAGALHNRYVGDWLLWGSAGSGAWALRYAAAAPAVALQPGHAVERIEAMGEHAMLVGNAGGDLNFSAVRLGRSAALAGRHVQAGARQAESRTHGFFFRATGAEEGLLGLPVLRPPSDRQPGGPLHRGAGAAAVVFLRQAALEFQPLGELQAQAGRQRDDACKASCVDWYGNARPIFLGDRVFALLGYELVEGRLFGDGESERIAERRRISFAPTAAIRGGRPTPFD